MSLKSVWESTSPRNRRLVVGGTLLVVLVAIVIGIAASRGEEDSARAPVGAGDMAGMDGMDMAGMDMSSGGSVRLSAAQIREFGVTFDFAEYRTLSNEVRTVGAVTFDETRMAQVAPKFGGFVERLYVDFTGHPVQRGQPLLEIYSPELVAAQQELLLAARLDANLGQSAVPGVSAGDSRLAEAAIRRLQLWDISEAQIREVLRSGEVRRTLTLHSPATGVVVEKQVQRGQAVEPGQTLYTIADLSEVWVEAELREADAGNVQVGAQASVDFTALPGRPFPGRVEYVYPVLQEQARTLRARISIANPGGLLKPGMYATVCLSAPERSALTVPTSAVVDTGERQIVFVDLGDGELAPADVVAGRTAGNYTEVISGVEPGQRVVTSAQFLLDSESNLGEVMRSMMGQMGSADMGSMDMGGMDMSAPGSTGGMEDRGADMRGMNMPGQEP